jgi:putative tricarboxylic transport membrane protein
MRFSRDSIAGFVCLALSLWLLYLSQGLPRNPLVPIGPDFYPRVVLVIMAVLSALLIASDLISGWRAPRETPLPDARPQEPRNYRLVGATFAVFAGYVLLLPLLGFRVATFVFVAALQVVLEKPQDWRRWTVVVAAALVTVVVTYLAFDVYLSVLLPRGRWTGF